MARATASSMSVLVVRALTIGAMSRGIDARSLAERAGVPAELFLPENLADPDGRVLAGHVVKLWEFLPVALNDDCFGLSLANLAAGAPLSVGWWVVWSSFERVATRRGSVAPRGRVQQWLGRSTGRRLVARAGRPKAAPLAAVVGGAGRGADVTSRG